MIHRIAVWVDEATAESVRTYEAKSYLLVVLNSEGSYDVVAVGDEDALGELAAAGTQAIIRDVAERRAEDFPD